MSLRPLLLAAPVLAAWTSAFGAPAAGPSDPAVPSNVSMSARPRSRPDMPASPRPLDSCSWTASIVGFARIPTSFLPLEDQGYLLVSVQRISALRRAEINDSPKASRTHKG